MSLPKNPSEQDLVDYMSDLSDRIIQAADEGNWDEVPEGWAIDLATAFRRYHREGFTESAGTQIALRIYEKIRENP